MSIVAPGGSGKIELARGVALAEQRRQRLRDGRLGVGPDSSPASTIGTSGGVACS